MHLHPNLALLLSCAKCEGSGSLATVDGGRFRRLSSARMSVELGEKGTNVSDASQRYQRNFDSTHVTPFAALVEAISPGAGGRTIVKLLDGRAERTCTLHWKAGRRGPPAWALDLLRSKLAAKHELERSIAAKAVAGPGIVAGAANLAKWRVEQAKKKGPG
jgi:hypothetical protein